MKRKAIIFAIIILLFARAAGTARAQPEILPGIELNIGGEPVENWALGLQLLFLLTVLSLAPSIIIMMTSFTRIVIVLSLLRNALATQRMPPNQVLVGISLFLTFFIMAPVFADINERAIQPYLAEEISTEEAMQNGLEPLRDFMVRQTDEKDLALFIDVAAAERPAVFADIPTHIIIPAFIVSELKKAFQIGFLIYLPFIIIDMVVASILMGMGMMMLPPVMISLPFKILLFVLVDGWFLVVKSLVTTFN